MKGTFGVHLNKEMKATGDAKTIWIWLFDTGGNSNGLDWNDAKVTIGEHEELTAGVTNNCGTLLTEIPIKLWL